MIGLLSVLLFGLVVLLLGDACVATLQERREARFSRAAAASALAVWIAGTALLMRPHRDTLIGLDTSCYRLMAQSLEHRASWRQSDATLRRVPPELRRAFLLEYEKAGRDTRDRSYEIVSLKGCGTKPYFYPTLPLLANGLRLAGGGDQRLLDYAVPCLGSLLLAGLLVFSLRWGGWGPLLAGGLLFASPIPVWTFRGFFAESAAAALAMAGLVEWAAKVPPGPLRLARRGLMWGLAVCFHPVALVLSLPGLLLTLVVAGGRRERLFLLGGFAAGMLPLLALTVWVCQPYGDFLAWRDWAGRMRRDQPVQILSLSMLLGLPAMLALLLAPTDRLERAGRSVAAAWASWRGRMLSLLLAASPGLLAATVWSQRAWVRQGAREWAAAQQVHLLALAGLLIGVACFSRRPPRVFALLCLTIAVAPVFLYLKGFEQMGMWSQRRLLPLVLLGVLAALPLAAAVTAGLRGRRRRVLLAGWGGLLAAALLANPLRWAAPWKLVSERGVERWVASIEKQIAGRLTLFDYFPYSVPFANRPGVRALGLADGASRALPQVMDWLRETATDEPVIIVSAWQSPGLEAGLDLVPISTNAAAIPVIRSRYSLPAEEQRRRVHAQVLEARPARAGGRLVLDKRMDGGPLALRGPWGRGGTVTNAAGERFPAAWTRQRSGVIGPLPGPDDRVRITVWAASGRPGAQRMQVHPPGGGEPVRLSFGPVLAVATATLAVAEGSAPAETTGIYRFSADQPYDPKSDGIGGYDKDLGVLLQRIRIEPVGP